MPVVVDLGQAVPTLQAAFGPKQSVPLRVSSGGLRFTGNVPGLLHAWARSWNGVWLGLVEFTASTGNGRGQLAMRQWCPEHSLAPPPNSAGKGDRRHGQRDR